MFTVTVTVTVMGLVRVTAHSSAGREALQADVWQLRGEGVQTLYVERPLVLEETASERLMYLVFNPPFLARREADMRSRRLMNASTGRSRRAGAPWHEQAVRVKTLDSAWHFIPDGHGGTTVHSVTLTDLGLPLWLVGPQQRQIALSALNEVLTRVASQAVVEHGARGFTTHTPQN